jgi:hypothetical protein
MLDSSEIGRTRRMTTAAQTRSAIIAIGINIATATPFAQSVGDLLDERKQTSPKVLQYYRPVLPAFVIPIVTTHTIALPGKMITDPPIPH